MLFCFDESGNFAVPGRADDYRVAVVAGLAIADKVSDPLRAAFQGFVARLAPSELHSGEPKGRLMRNESLDRFCDLLAGFDGVSLTPVTLVLSLLADWHVDDPVQHMHNLLQEQAQQMVYPTAREQVALLARQFRNLSLPQMLRIFSITNCMREALQHAVIFLSNRGHESSWWDVRYEIDRVQVRRGSREEKLMSFFVLSWLTAWSRNTPFTLVREIHTASHPFVQAYDTEAGVDIGKLVRGRVHWVDSSSSWGVQMADIAAHVVYRAVSSLEQDEDAEQRFASLMRSSAYGPRRGPGLFSPFTAKQPAALAQKFSRLSRLMRA